VRRLDGAGVDVRVFPGRPAPRSNRDKVTRSPEQVAGSGDDITPNPDDVMPSPDEVFPNNWLSTHADGTLVLYPLMAPSRRRERRAEIVEALRAELEIRRVVDLSGLERLGVFLEGTGSLVLDRPARAAFACLSPRTSEAGLRAFENELGYRVHAFAAVDSAARPIYHTNVMLSLGTCFAVVCGEAVPDGAERRRLFEALEGSGRALVDIGFREMAGFAANVLELEGRSGAILALSTRALHALDPLRRRALEKHVELVPADVGTIETYGGGSVRCMLAEIHVERRV
jgi:hypothetical protein